MMVATHETYRDRPLTPTESPVSLFPLLSKESHAASTCAQ